MFLLYPWNNNSNLLLQTSYDMYLAEQLHGTWYVYFCLESRGKIWGYFCEFGVMKPSGLARTCQKHECPGDPSYCAPRSAKTYIDCCFSRNTIPTRCMSIYVMYVCVSTARMDGCMRICVCLFQQITLIYSIVLDKLTTCTHEKQKDIRHGKVIYQLPFQENLSNILQQVQSPPLNPLSFPVVGTRWSRSRWFRDLFLGRSDVTKMDQGVIGNGTEKNVLNQRAFPLHT